MRSKLAFKLVQLSEAYTCLSLRESKYGRSGPSAHSFKPLLGRAWLEILKCVRKADVA